MYFLFNQQNPLDLASKFTAEAPPPTLPVRSKSAICSSLLHIAKTLWGSRTRLVVKAAHTSYGWKGKLRDLCLGTAGGRARAPNGAAVRAGSTAPEAQATAP